MPSVDELSARLGVRLPEGTRVLGVDSETGIDDLVRAKVEISKAHLTSFLATTAIPRFEQVDADILGPDREFWDPHKASNLRVGDVQLPNARFLVVAIDEGRPQVAVLYLINHGT